MEEQKKERRGGIRAGAGRKGKGFETVHRAFRLRVDDYQLIKQTAEELGISQADVIHELIEEYKRNAIR